MGYAVGVGLCCGNLRLELLVRALKFSAHALTYLFLNRADGICALLLRYGAVPCCQLHIFA